MDLSGRVAVVTGASYGVGKGVALGLAEAGAHVYATGRTVSEDSFDADARILPRAATTRTTKRPRRSSHACSKSAEYGFTDIDGKQPPPLTLEDV